MRRLRISLEARLVAVTSGVLVLMSITLFVGLAARERASLISAKTSAALMLTQLLANELSAAVDFDDMEDVRTSLNFLRSNPDISAAAVWTLAGSDEPEVAWTAPGAPIGGRPSAGEPDGAATSGEWLLATRTVVGLHNKPLARARIVFTLRPENEAYRSSRRTLFWMTAGWTAVASLLLGLLARRYAVGPIKRLASAATALADGNSKARVDVRTNNEIGDLARAFNVMSEAVAFREQQLKDRNDDMQIVLDHVAQGLFTIDRTGRISPEYSRALAEWLGPPAAGDTLWDYMGRFQSRLGLRMRIGWEAVIEDVLPIEVTLDQMPQALRTGGRDLRFGYLPITANGALNKVLVVVSDVTSDIARERADEAQRELLRMFEHFSRDRSGFGEFFAEADGLVRRIAETGALSADLKRSIHTLKGNCAQFGLSSIAALCHDIESRVVETGALLAESDRDELRRAWAERRAKLSLLLGEHRNERIEIEPAEYARLLADLEAGVPPRRIANEVRLWRLEPTAQRLERIARQATNLAARLGKGRVRVVLEPNGLRLEPRAWGPFWSAFVHVIRNALDHGIETEAERAAAGKDGPGTLVLRTYLTDEDFVVEASDDGRGLDWDLLAARCRALGLACANRQQIEEALFGSGISTKTEVSEHSGRGVGMGAVVSACSALGGKLRIQSGTGTGTMMQFRFPTSAMGHGRGWAIAAPPTVAGAGAAGRPS